MRRSGFTLIELVVVLLILGLIAGLVAPQIMGRVADARQTAAKAQIEMLSAALDNYRLDAGSYPTTSQGLTALRERPARPPVPRNWRGPYLRKAVPDDPWGRPYVYASPGRQNAAGFDLYSLGRDGRMGGEGEDADIGRP
jgi:general secretion pathway protein G